MASVRRLSAIMFTDMVGSTAAAQANEAGALKLRDEQAGLVRPLFAAHQGREIKSTGDGSLAEFDSALRAVQCAIDIQQHLHERNSQPGASPIELRIGIHLGDVEQRETDIFGDAVNIASRIEPLSSPGGICISGEVYSQVRNKIPNRFEKLPPTALKGLQEPIDIYRVLLPWNVREQPSASNGPIRLAVLPFTNMSTDPADLYFADGLTEELIAVLSQLRELRVIARTSVMPYKSSSKGVSQIGAELRVSSILEGSVRKAGNRLRVTAQLIEVESEDHVWAKSYDRQIDDVFAVQAELAAEVADALKIELRPTETARLEARPSVRPDSYLAYLKGRSLLQSDWSEKIFRDAREQFELALSLDPTNARAHSGLADALIHLKWGRYETVARELDQAIRDNVAQALALDPGLAEAHCSMGNIVWDEHKNLETEKEFRLALSLNPSYATAHSSLGQLLLTFARPEEALQELVLAEELDPTSVFYSAWHCSLLFFLRRLDEEAVRLERLREIDREGRSYHGNLGFYHFARSEFGKALKEADLLDGIKPGEGTNLRIWNYTAIGRKDEAWNLIKQEEARPGEPDLNQLAQWHVAVGDIDRCFQYLDAALDRNELAIQIWRVEPKFEPVRVDPRFGNVLKKLNLSPIIT
ncbi:MAG: adenylate/guanylate cyclase domain-containing protein [Thermoplasmata archaeon]